MLSTIINLAMEQGVGFGTIQVIDSVHTIAMVENRSWRGAMRKTNAGGLECIWRIVEGESRIRPAEAHRILRAGSDGDGGDLDRTAWFPGRLG